MPQRTFFEERTVQHDPGGKVRRSLALGVRGAALFGGDQKQYRYVLRRTWNIHLPAFMFLMMNPSTADTSVDDPTVARCQAFARKWGGGSLYVTNTFAYRATDPRDLLAAPDPVGPENDRHILATAYRVSRIIIAYGQPHRALRQRGLDVCALLRGNGHKLHALKLNADGSPRHPLYINGEAEPFVI
ncbi:DUF1643 domain-containing protein [Terriglobus saanensis]|uniref:DUF1643 domain-containing protein n=1 Tax=Terriglobus saanensis (strain ATCC BAA-1853 / DSM 23119 / SP1PR4) TaxID=401053 RepID=E8UYL2_TERSS|nr:DUF1643 domain-containing protein [Terriglobus saanensis]ADV83165.1 protein of unknown function DUF1643 [Terriglobus saanensis SP1PR4]